MAWTVDDETRLVDSLYREYRRRNGSATELAASRKRVFDSVLAHAASRNGIDSSLLPADDCLSDYRPAANSGASRNSPRVRNRVRPIASSLLATLLLVLSATGTELLRGSFVWNSTPMAAASRQPAVSDTVDQQYFSLKRSYLTRRTVNRSRAE